MLILITGLPGSGKTTLAKAYAVRYGALHLNSDLMRRELGLMGHYGPEDKKRVYAALLKFAHRVLQTEREVVLDSTFYKEAIREPFRRVAAECAARLLWVEVRAGEETIHERLQSPRLDSEADFAVFEKIRNEYEPLQEPHLVLWSDAMPLDEMTAAMREYIAAYQPT